MSTVIRDAIIRVKLEHQKSAAESGRERQTAQGYEEVARAAKESDAALDQVGRTSADVSAKMLVNFREGGEGALRMARGIAFLSASGSDSLQKLMQKVALAQGAFDVFAGGSKVFSRLATVIGSSYSAAIVGTTALLGAAVMKYQAYQRAAEEAERVAREAAEKTRRAIEKQIDALFGLDRAQRRLSGRRGEMLIQGALTPEAQAGREAFESRRLAREAAGISAEIRRPPDAAEKRISLLLDHALKYNQPGDEGALREAIQKSPTAARRMAALNSELADTLEKRWHIEKTLADRQVQQGKGAFEAFQVASGSALGFGQLANPAFAIATSHAEQQYKDMITRLQKPLDAIVATIEAAADRAARIEKDLTEANPQ